MNTATNYAHLFSESVDDKTTLEKNVTDNPASSFARFLLLYYYKKTNDPGFEKFAKQSSLYFNNSYWLQLQLSENDFKHDDSNFINPSSLENSGHFAITFPENFHSTKEEDKEQIIPAELRNENIQTTETFEITNDNFPEEKEEIIFAESEEKNRPANESIEIVNDNLHKETQEENIAFEPKEETLETDRENNNAPFAEENKNETDVAFGQKEEMENRIELINNHFANEEMKEEMNPSGSQTSDANPLISNDTKEESIAFEPLYTVDYFASQGIKIKEEALMDDKLGKQMKSFTAWLKSMKKLHPGKLPEQNEVIEKIIQSSAEESNADAEVLTEAMAEVLTKQNKEEKAIEMYQKLSLLNPSKSAYFAAKIESLKTN